MTTPALRLAAQEYDPAIPVGDVSEHPDNYQQGDVGAVSESIAEHGLYGAIGVQRSTRLILSGNHRYRTAVMTGAATLPGLWLDVDDDEAARIMAVDNRTSALSTPDEAALVALLTRAAEGPRGLAGTGYDGDDLDEMVAMLGHGPVLTDQPSDAAHNETDDDAAARRDRLGSYEDTKKQGALTELILVLTVDEHTEATQSFLARVRQRDGDLAAGALVLAALRAYAP